MKYRILIKDLSNNIKEEYWDLNENQTNKFIDSNNVGYAVSFLLKEKKKIF
jgi:hypothetical protein